MEVVDYFPAYDENADKKKKKKIKVTYKEYCSICLNCQKSRCTTDSQGCDILKNYKCVEHQEHVEGMKENEKN